MEEEEKEGCHAEVPMDALFGDEDEDDEDDDDEAKLLIVNVAQDRSIMKTITVVLWVHLWSI